MPRWKLSAGLWLYDLLAAFRNVGRHRWLSKRTILRTEPGLRERGLKGGARYWDAQCDDARLTLANVRDAHRHGALPVNYAEVTQLEYADGAVRGARVTDRVTGEEYTIHAHLVVNATGPWSDRLRADGRTLLQPTKGVHAAVPRSRIGNTEAITLTSPIDGRVMFILPWNDLTYIGTTDTDFEGSPDDLHATHDDVVYLLRSANAFFPDARLQPADVVSTWAGLRPLVKPPDPTDPSAVPREHTIIEQPGMISIVGGKLTTYRAMAAEAVDRVAKLLHRLDGRKIPPRAPTATEPLPGGEARDPDLLVSDAEREGASREVALHLVRAYGTEAPAVIRLAKSDRRLADPIVPGHPALRAEMIHAIRREMAVTLSDLLIRRTHVFYETADHAAAQAPELVDLVSAEFGWDPARKAGELAAYLEESVGGARFRSDEADPVG